MSPCQFPPLVSFGLSHVRWNDSPLDPGGDIGRPSPPFVFPSTKVMVFYSEVPHSFHCVVNRTWIFGFIPLSLEREWKIVPIHVWCNVHVARDRAFARLPRTPSSTSSRTSATSWWNETSERIHRTTCKGTSRGVSWENQARGRTRQTQRRLGRHHGCTWKAKRNAAKHSFIDKAVLWCDASRIRPLVLEGSDLDGNATHERESQSGEDQPWIPPSCTRSPCK